MKHNFNVSQKNAIFAYTLRPKIRYMTAFREIILYIFLLVFVGPLLAQKQDTPPILDDPSSINKSANEKVEILEKPINLNANSKKP